MSANTPIYVAVVDDDESVCRSLGRVLRASGMQPIGCASAEAYLAYTKTSPIRLLGPRRAARGMSGIELARRLAADGGHAPFIFTTAHDDSESRAAAQAAGCVAYFRKTDSGVQFVETIRRAASYSSLRALAPAACTVGAPLALAYLPDIGRGRPAATGPYLPSTDKQRECLSQRALIQQTMKSAIRISVHASNSLERAELVHGGGRYAPGRELARPSSTAAGGSGLAAV